MRELRYLKKSCGKVRVDYLLCGFCFLKGTDQLIYTPNPDIFVIQFSYDLMHVISQTHFSIVNNQNVCPSRLTNLNNCFTSTVVSLFALYIYNLIKCEKSRLPVCRLFRIYRYAANQVSKILNKVVKQSGQRN